MKLDPLGIKIVLWIGAVLATCVAIAALVGCLGGFVNLFGGAGCTLKATSLMLTVAGWFLGMAGTLLNFVMGHLVIGMGELIGEKSGVGLAISEGWAAIRDVANIAFIGGLVWASIAMILGLSSVKPGHLIGNIILAAILVNFSFFFAGVIVDASNILSRNIYNTAISTVPAGEVKLNFSDIFMKKTALTSVYDLPKALADDPEAKKETIFLIGLMGAILFITTASVFFVTSFLLLYRFVVIVILLILSPFGILKITGLPYISDLGGTWWKALMSQAIFPPAYLLMVGLSFKIINAVMADVTQGTSYVSLVTGAAKAGQAGGSAAAFSSFDGGLSLLAAFAISIGLMLASLEVARKISQSVPEVKGVYDFTRKSLGTVAQTAFRAAKAPLWVANKTVGDAGKAVPIVGALATVANSRMGKFFGQHTFENKLGPALAEDFKTGVEYLQKTGTENYQQKNINIAKRLLGKKGELTDAEQTELSKALAHLTPEQLYQLAQKGGIGGGIDESKLELIGKHGPKDAIATMMKIEGLSPKQKDELFNARFGKLDALNAKVAAGTATEDDLKAIENILSTMSDTETKLYFTERREYLAQKDIMSKLSSSQFVAAVLKNDDITRGQKKTAKESRYGDLDKPENVAATAGRVGNMTDAEIASLDPRILAHPDAAPYISESTRKAIQARDDLTAGQRKEIDDNIDNHGSEATKGAKGNLDAHAPNPAVTNPADFDHKVDPARQARADARKKRANSLRWDQLTNP